MGALRIPRKDHDVYCIDITGKPKRQLQAYIDEQLLRMHPVYGAGTVADIKRLKHNEHEWAIVTVMRKETLEEYRILYPHTAFVTATSLAVFQKDFFTKEAQVCGCERIWFDAQRQLVISEEAGTETCEEEPVTQAGRRSVIFGCKYTASQAAGIGLCIIVAAAIIVYAGWSAFYPTRQDAAPTERQDTAETEMKEEAAVTPCRFLEVIAEHTPAMQALLERYYYTDAEGVVCTFRTGSMETGITEFQNVPYRTGCALKEIVQKDRNNVVTIQTEPMIRQTAFIPAPDPAAIARFTDALKMRMVNVSATAGDTPAVPRKKSTHTIQNAPNMQNVQLTMNGLGLTLSCFVKTERIDAVLYDIEVISKRCSFGMSLLEVAVSESERLSIHAEFRQTGENDNRTKTEQMTGRSAYGIARAFGYTEETFVKEIPKQEEKPKRKPPVIPEGSVEIGKIKTGGKIKIYYRTPEGKIIGIESNS